MHRFESDGQLADPADYSLEVPGRLLPPLARQYELFFDDVHEWRPKRHDRENSPSPLCGYNEESIRPAEPDRLLLARNFHELVARRL